MAFIFVNRGRAKLPAAGQSSSPADRTLFNLQVGDILQHIGIDWVVEAVLLYDEDGFTWQEYLLQDGDRRAWLSVEEDDWVEVKLLKPITTLEISDTPPSQLVVDDVVYSCVESGTAKMKRVGRVHRPMAETCHFFDYDGPDNKALSIENWEGDIEVTVGEKIQPSELTILPGDGQSVHNSF